MVIYSSELDLIFGALSDGTRRSMLAQLSHGETNVTTLAAPHEMSQPAISKHLRVLERAGLIEKTKRGRETIIRAKAEPAEQARDWITYYAQFWKEQFDSVEEYLNQNEDAE
ncbi:MAG: metalloregulator ArsR/SmtB family transcription factor [Chloroflexota bacterium]